MRAKQPRSKSPQSRMLCSPTLHPRALQSVSGFQSSSHFSASWVTGIIESLPARMKHSDDGKWNSPSRITTCGAVQSVAETMQQNDGFVVLHSYIGVHASGSSKENEGKEEQDEEEKEGDEEIFVSRMLEHSFRATDIHENSDIGINEATTPWSLGGSSNLISEGDESIVENEKRRRMKIAERNKGQVPWNKGIRYTQEGRLLGTTKEVGGDVGGDASLLKKEKQRRQRISSANKGKTPWNKGRQHSEETRRRIRERTMEAMKNPEIREKLRVHGSSLSLETRSKISSSLSLVWDARKKTKQVQESLIEEWRECIADAARRGDGSNVAYEWNSYNLILKELQYAWSLNRKKRKKKESSIGLSIDHRIKISNAIKTKWANLEYRNMVRAGIHAHWAKQSSEPTPRRRHVRRKEALSQSKEIDVVVKSSVMDMHSAQSREMPEIIQSKKPSTYKNPSSAEMMKKLKQIREARILADAKRKEAADRARILMAEAQKATKALEAAAAFDKSALVPLREAQKLLAEAALSFKSAGLDMGLSYDTHNV